jgi:uncharacterized protein YcfL
MYKTIIILLMLFIFNGCSTKKEIFLHKTQSLIEKDWIKNINITKNNSIATNVLKNNKELFNNNDNVDNMVLTINEDNLINDNNNIQYTKLKSAYQHVIEFQNLNNINLKSYDYLKLYKALRLSQNKLFKSLKDTIIKRFMIEIENNINYDRNKIYKVLKEEKMNKINQLIKLLRKNV